MKLKRIALRKDYQIHQVMFLGFLLRLVLLVFILTVGTLIVEPYFISDDIKYEETVAFYLQNASKIVDIRLLGRIAGGYIQPFWPIVICVCGAVFHTIYAGRLLNIFMSTICIQIIYKLTECISCDEKTAAKAAKLFAYLPLTVFTCCFPIKDIYITLSVIYAFYIFVLLQNQRSITAIQILSCILLLIGVYFTRGAITEMMLLMFAVFFFMRFKSGRRYWAMAFEVLFTVFVIYIFRYQIIAAFRTKIDDYGGDVVNEGGIALLQINSLSQIYRLPFAYFFALLQPLKTDLVSFDTSSFWLQVLGYLNISIFPIAIGDFLYIFCAKKNFFLWIASGSMYCAVIILSLGVFRHYLFLVPIHIINYSLCMESKPRWKWFSFLGTYGLVLLLLLWTVRKNI